MLQVDNLPLSLITKDLPAFIVRRGEALCT
jgi:hypothetical protein